MSDLPDDGPALTDEEEAALALLDFRPECSHEGCRQDAAVTLHAFHRLTRYGYGFGEECLPSRSEFCAGHAREVRRLIRWQYLVCVAHGAPILTRFDP